MLHVDPLPTGVPRPPTQIVLGVYLRGLREAKGVPLKDAARVTETTFSSLARWERGGALMRPHTLAELLRYYGVAGKHADYLVRHLPPENFTRRESDEQGLTRRAPHDYWADVAGLEASARRLAVMRRASDIVEFCMLVPAGLRTLAYRRAVLDSAFCMTPDEVVPGMPL